MIFILNRLLRSPRHNRCIVATAIAIFIIVLNAKVFFLSDDDDGAKKAGAVGSSSSMSIATSPPIRASTVKVEPRAYDPWPANRPLPCSPSPSNLFSESNQRSSSNHGFLFVRLLKTGSASFLSSMIRASQQIVRRKHHSNDGNDVSYTTCDMRVQHGWATDFDYSHRVIGKSYLYSLLRHPNERAVSRFFYSQVSQKDVEATDENFKNFMLWTHNNFYLQGLRLTKYDPNAADGVSHEEVVNEIINSYDFIAITERMDESIVAMQMLLGLNTTDMLYFPTRYNGGFDHGSGPNKECVFIKKAVVTPGMQAFFDSDQWRKRSDGDFKLYQAANQSLDLTIDRLGRNVFEEQLARFRLAQQQAKAKCQVTFPCTPAGSYNPDHDCVFEDSACGQSCLDQVAMSIDHPTTTTTTTTSTTSQSDEHSQEGSTKSNESSGSKEGVSTTGTKTTTDEEDGEGEEGEEEGDKSKESSKSSEEKSDTSEEATESKPKEKKDSEEEEEGSEEEDEGEKSKPKVTKKTDESEEDGDEEEEEKSDAKAAEPKKETTASTTTKDSEEEEEGEEETGKGETTTKVTEADTDDF